MIPKQIQTYLNELDTELDEWFEYLRENEYSNVELNKQPSPDAWSVFETMHHVLRTERLALEQMYKRISTNYQELKKIRMDIRLRQFILKQYLHTPIKHKASKVLCENLPKDSNLDYFNKVWEKLRSDLHEFLHNLPKEAYSKEVYRHNIAGGLDIEGTLYYFLEHFRRHRKQMVKILGTVTES